MDIGSLLLGLALFLLVAFVVAAPLFERRQLHEKELSAADTLTAERETLLTALRDLDFDHATGKISAEDYAPQRAQLVAQGVEVLKQLDALGLSERAPAADGDDAIERAIAARRKPATGRTADESIEAQIAARRKPASDQRPAPAAGKVTCSNCGTLANSGDRFCPKCGQTLALTCLECGRPIRPGDHFCAACGAKLQPAEAAG
jgi:RNA polymerase subunit RPABC4/transcription elongation factor Spt4